MKILCVPTGPLSVNTYIVFNESAETPSNSERIPCVVIDPANSHKVVEVLNQNNLHCTHILLTHGHFDHTMGVAELKSHENALVPDPSETMPTPAPYEPSCSEPRS